MGRKTRLSAPPDGSPPKVKPLELQALGGFRHQEYVAFRRLEIFTPIKVSVTASARDLLVAAVPHGR
jgi:hypothetical protein